MAIFEVTRDGTTVEDAVFDVDPVVDTANPFGDYCVVKIDDRGGQKFENYPRGTRIDVSITEDGTTTDRFTGYVVERRETEQSGADVLEVEAYSFDQFLRRNTVTNDQRGNTITEALADIIQTDTPVSYVAGNVTVGDDQELTRAYQGEAVENVLRDLAFKSNNEDFGVNDSLEFFFRPRETVHIDRGIDNTQWFNYDIPELGKEAINEVEVWFDDGEESVIVDDGTDKLDLQDSLGLPSPGTQRAELNRPLITDIGDAEDIGRKYLAFKNATLSGTVTTYGLFEAEPGDTIDITIDPRGIDAEFVIAGMEYRWGRDQTILTIVEKRGDVDGILSELNDSVQRQEMESANRDAPKNRITTTNATAIVSVTADADGNTPDADRFVNAGRNAVRDAWTGDNPPDITTLVVGSDNTGLSRTNTALVNQTNSATVSQTLPDAKSVEFSAIITQTGVQEIGLEAADGTLITRATFDSAVDLDGTVTVTLTVSNDDSVSRGVLTNDGQTAVRDVLADNSPDLPDQYAYGSDGAAVAETDTALGNELVTVSLDEILIQSADTQAEWESLIGTIADDVPLTIDSTGPRTQQVCWTREGEDYDRGEEFRTAEQTPTEAVYSGGDSACVVRDSSVSGGPDFAEWDFTVDHTIPSARFGVAVRVDADDTNSAPGHEWTLEHADGNTYEIDDAGSGTIGSTLSWDQIGDGFYNNLDGYQGPDLTPGDYTLVCDVTDSGGTTDFALYVDVVAPYDNDESLTFDDDNGGSSGYLDGPEKYPALIERSLSTASTRRNVTEASFDLSANDVSNNFYVELANDGSTFTRVNNSETGIVNFASPDSGVDVNLGLSRYSATSTQTPLNGNDFQQIDTWELTADVDAILTDNIGETVARAVVPPNTSGIVGNTVREAGLKSSGDLLTRHVLAEFTLESGQRLASSETTLFTSDN